MDTIVPQGYQKTADGDIMPPLHLIQEDKGDYTEYQIYGTPIEGLLVWKRKKYDDNRGSYQELDKVDEIRKVYPSLGEIKQTSLSRNKPAGVLRGIHAEPMDKIVTLLNGVVFIAIVDLRPKSSTFGEYVSFMFDQRDGEKPVTSLVVANGLGNSFLTIGQPDDPMVNYLYRMTESYKTSEGKRSIKWDDPDIKDAVNKSQGIAWPIEPTIMSEVDANGNPGIKDLFPEKF